MSTYTAICARCSQEGACLVWTGHVSTAGVPQLGIQGSRRYIPTRRAVMEAHGIVVPDGQCVIPECRNSLCVRFEHLKIMSRGDVSRLALLEGKINTPERRAAITAGRRKTAKLTPDAVADILAAPSGAEAARRHGIHRSMANRIRRGEAWIGAVPGASSAQTQCIPTAPGRYEVTEAIERAITADYLLRRQGVDLPSRFPAAFWNREPERTAT